MADDEIVLESTPPEPTEPQSDAENGPKIDFLPSRPVEELNKLAKDIATNLVFTSNHIRDNHLTGSIFMPLILGAMSNFSEEGIKSVGMVYEYFDKAGPRAINGYPMFMSCAFLNQKDTEYVWEKYNKIKSVLDAVGEL